MPRKIEISHRTILFTLGILAVVWFIIQVREILFLLFVSLILVSALHSPVSWLAKRKIPRPLSIIVFYLLIFTMFIGGLALLIPPFIEQTKIIVSNTPFFLGAANQFFLYQLPIEEIIKSLSSNVNVFGSNIFRYTLGFFGNIITLVSIFVFTFYLLLRWDNLGKLLSAGFASEERISRLLNRIEIGLGNWVRGEFLLMVIIGVMSYIGLTLLGVPSALPLAIAAGILEIVPIIGPIISAIPAVLVALAVSPLLALATVALYFVIQQLENNLIVPKVMERAVGIDPLGTILALMIGANLMGMLGAFLAVPFVVLAKIIIIDFYQHRK
ncbi:MAG: AI-2E family transporter [bacterium]|nr:AI-2E family transporter [bacterium]